MKKTPPYSLLVEQTSPISIPQWEEILRDVVMFADKIWLHRSASAFDSSLETAIGQHYKGTYHDLIDAGIIQFYSYESDSSDDCKNSSRIITRDEHMLLYNSIIEKVNKPDSYQTDSLSDPERTSRIIEKRNELWKYGLAAILDSEISIECNNSKSMKDEIANRSLEAQMTSELFSAFQVPSITHLSAADILDLRTRSQKHRQYIQEMIIKAKTDSDKSVADVVNEELSKSITQMNQLLTDVAGNSAVKKFLINTGINIAGLIPMSYAVMVPLTALLCGNDLVDLLQSRKRYGFVLFMNSIRDKATQVKRPNDHP